MNANPPRSKLIKRACLVLALMMVLVLADVSSALGEALPGSAYISGVPAHAQKHSLSCEARSSADLAAYWGISLGENEFLGVLPRAGNPEQGFVGSPDDPWGHLPPHGYGVHAGPVAATLRTFGLQAEAHSGLGWDDLRREISAGRPVIVWIIGQMWSGKAIHYQAPDGSTSIVAAFEHTMILVGYSRDTVQVVDAYSGQYQTYPLWTFLNSWAVLGNMAVFSSLDASANASPPVEPPAQTYTVQPGDYLIELANRFGTTLQALIDLNSVPYPYTIYPGQVLQLPIVELPPAAPAVAATAVPTPAPTIAPTATTQAARVVKFQVRLPLVHRDYTFQKVTGDVKVPASQDALSPASSPRYPGLRPSASREVDRAVLTHPRSLLVPVLVDNSRTLLH